MLEKQPDSVNIGKHMQCFFCKHRLMMYQTYKYPACNCMQIQAPLPGACWFSADLLIYYHCVLYTGAALCYTDEALAAPSLY